MSNLCNGLVGTVVLGVFVLQFQAVQYVQAQERTVYSFCTETNCTDGAGPHASLIDVNGTFYGTTLYGGSSTGCDSGGCGTVFSLDPSTGAETALYSFCSQTNCADGAVPYAGLIDVNGTLYGTTLLGGYPGCAYNTDCGTIFSLDPKTRVETVVYSFCSRTNCPDAANPEASLIDVNGTLYGTTYGGGAHNNGAVFSFDPSSGAETVIYSFCSQSNCEDGANPEASLINVKGTLYGTTVSGGNVRHGETYGTVFSFDLRTGTETVLYSFCQQSYCTDGAYPISNLIEINGVLYGTTAYGGTGRCTHHIPGCGTVFSLDLNTGAEKALYPFCNQTNCTDGAYPISNLIEIQGNLYGTTVNGGNVRHGNTYGTVFSLDIATGTETVLHSFCSLGKCRDGAAPIGGLLRVSDKLYGTTFYDGVHGEGTVFSVKAP